MLSASTLYLQTLKHSHRVANRCRLFDGGAYVGILNITGGSFTFDAEAAHRRRCDLEVAVDPYETTSREALEQVTTEQGEVALDAGIVHTDGSIEYVEYARLRITRYERSQSSATAKLEAYDATVMMDEGIVDDVTLDPLLPAGLDWKTAVARVVANAVPGATVTNYPGLPAFGIDDEDRLGQQRSDLVRQWLDQADAELVNGPDGEFILRPAPAAPSATPHWVIEGGAVGTLVDVTEVWAREEQYNAVWLRWTDSEANATYIGQQVDADPSSPTFYGGPFGRRTKVIEDVPVSSDVEAGQKAAQILKFWQSSVSGLEIIAVRNPLLEGGDTVEVLIPRTGTRENHLVRSLEWTFGDADMTVNTKVIR